MIQREVPSSGVAQRFEPLAGESQAIDRLRSQITRFARAASNILITGETGTGKELVANAIHQLSARCHHPFICLNCAAIPETLFESELFGYERGAFTGAFRTYQGKLQEAGSGTLFLDEIGELSAASQAKLLRAVESKQVYRLGGREPHAVHFRLVAATNRDLDAMARDGAFRQDLLYRLKVGHIHIPPLRERIDDLPLLLARFMEECNTRFGVRVRDVTPAALEFLSTHTWPGNIRELRNAIESIYLNLPDPAPPAIELEYLTPVFPDASRHIKLSEEDILLAALVETNWNKSRAAAKLKWSRMTVYRKMAKLQMNRDRTVSPAETFVTPDVTEDLPERNAALSQTASAVASSKTA
jgi:transcriptional regulator with PAS, ATPase and Fis domain